MTEYPTPRIGSFMDYPAEVPVQEFQVGERVICNGFTGTVVAYHAQVYAENLFRVAWDGDTSDFDAYPASSLNSIYTEQDAA